MRPGLTWRFARVRAACLLGEAEGRDVAYPRPRCNQGNRGVLWHEGNAFPEHSLAVNRGLSLCIGRSVAMVKGSGTSASYPVDDEGNFPIASSGDSR